MLKRFHTFSRQNKYVWALPDPYCDKYYCCFTRVKTVKWHISFLVISAGIYIIFIKSDARCIPDLPSNLFFSSCWWSPSAFHWECNCCHNTWMKSSSGGLHSILSLLSPFSVPHRNLVHFIILNYLFYSKAARCSTVTNQSTYSFTVS